jgi:glutamyl-tRNA reductase
MSILAFGINYTKASIALREQATFAVDELSYALASLSDLSGVSEVVLISTCNRTEIYCRVDGLPDLEIWLADYKQIDLQSLRECCYCYHGVEAAKHLLQVVCGLDSMVLGEPQILGQVKASFVEACLQATVGQTLSQLFRQAFTVAKKVRTSTSIGVCPVSVASTAVELVKTNVTSADLTHAHVLLVGAGDTIKLLLRHLASSKPKSISIASRHVESAEKLCAHLPVMAYALSEVPRLIPQVDIVFTATASPDPVITKAMFAQNSSQKKLSIVDIAVPRDVEPAVADLPHVSLYNIDDLKAAIKSNINVREHAAKQAHQMIDEMAKAFMLSLRALEATPVIKRFRSYIEELCEQELAKAVQSYDQGQAPKEVLQQLSRSVANKLMHTPCVQMKQASSEGRSEVLQVANELFGMTEEIS